MGGDPLTRSEKKIMLHALLELALDIGSEDQLSSYGKWEELEASSEFRKLRKILLDI